MRAARGVDRWVEVCQVHKVEEDSKQTVKMKMFVITWSFKEYVLSITRSTHIPASESILFYF